MVSFLVILNEKWRREWKQNSAKLKTIVSQGSSTVSSGRIMNSLSRTCILYNLQARKHFSWASLFSGVINFYKTRAFEIDYSKISSCSMWIVNEKQSFDNGTRETFANALRKSLTSKRFQYFAINAPLPLPFELRPIFTLCSRVWTK